MVSNFKLTMQEIHRLGNEIKDLRKSLEFTQNNLEEKVDYVEKRMEKLDSVMNFMNTKFMNTK